MTKQEIVIVADRSGSMAGKEADTVGGINVMLNELNKNKSADDSIKVSLKLFDHQELLLWRRLELLESTTFDIDKFNPRGQTALLDAIGNTILYFINLKSNDVNAFDTAQIYIATDGFENASISYNRDAIKKLIETAKNFNINIIYMAANQDAILEAATMGIGAGQAINYTENAAATQAVYRSAARMATESRQNYSEGRSASEPIAFTNAERCASHPAY